MTRLVPHLALWVLAVALPGPAHSQSPMAIRAGRLVDVERGEIRTDQVVLVRDGRIESTRPAPLAFRRAFPSWISLVIPSCPA
jgi:hypothetical protein